MPRPAFAPSSAAAAGPEGDPNPNPAENMFSGSAPASRACAARAAGAGAAANGSAPAAGAKGSPTCAIGRVLRFEIGDWGAMGSILRGEVVETGTKGTLACGTALLLQTKSDILCTAVGELMAAHTEPHVKPQYIKTNVAVSCSAADLLLDLKIKPYLVRPWEPASARPIWTELYLGYTRHLTGLYQRAGSRRPRRSQRRKEVAVRGRCRHRRRSGGGKR